MYQRITFSDFVNDFCRHNRTKHFSYDALEALFNHLESIEEDTGEQIELDVIGLCYGYTESTVDEIIAKYGLDASDCKDDDDRRAIVEEFLDNKTTIVWQRGDTFLYQQF